MSEEKDIQIVRTTKEHKNSINNSEEFNNISQHKYFEHLSNPSIVMTNATAKWTDSQTDNSIENINLTIRSGQLVIVIGPVGAGKVYILFY